MTSSTLTRPDTPTAPAPEGCRHLAVELTDSGVALDTLAKVVTMLRGRRWEVRALDADLDAGVLRLTVRTDDVELVVRQLERVVAVRSVRVDRPGPDVSPGAGPARPAG